MLYFNSGERKIIAKRQHTQPKNVLALANDIDALQTQVIAFLKRIGAKFV